MAIINGNNSDNIIIGTNDADIINGLGGNDTVDYSNGGAVTVDLQNGNASGGFAQGDILTSIENIIGSNSALSIDRDWLYGNSAANHLQGMAGDDILEGGAGADTIDGGAGWDYTRYTRSASGVNINLQTGINTGGDAEGDTLLNIEAVVGSGYDDVIIGNALGDYFRGENGNDYLSGGLGNDQLMGGKGNDTYVYTGGLDSFREWDNDAADRVVFDASLSPLSAQIVSNKIIFDAGVNEITFNNINAFEVFSFSGYADMSLAELTSLIVGNVDDVFLGTSAAENFAGGGGNDTVDYSNGGAVTIDLLLGAASGGFAQGDVLTSIENIIGSNSALASDRDTIYGDAQNNRILGMAGNDILEGGAGADLIDGGAGWDYARYTRSSSGVVINLQSGTCLGGDAQGDTLISIEAIVGSNYGDTIFGNAQNDYLLGENGDDYLSGGLGNDQVIGGNGNDTYVYTAGLDSFREWGSDTNDRVVFDSAYSPLDASIVGNKIIFDAGVNEITFNNINDIEYFVFDAYGAMTFAQFNALLSDTDDVFIGTSAAELFNGADGSDTVDYSHGGGVTVDLQTNIISRGFASDDTLISIENIIGSTSLLAADRDDIKGNSLNNHLQGLGGNDFLYGRSGNDWLEGGEGEDRITGGLGADIIDGGAGRDFAFYDQSLTGVNINLLTGVNSGGEAEGDTLISIEVIYGSNKNDVIIGSHSNDQFFGKAGDDMLYGNNGADSLNGENGNDYLDGGLGNDALAGGRGSDTYFYSAGIDTITEESNDIDTLIFASTYTPLAASISGNNIIFNAGVNEVRITGDVEHFIFDGYAMMTFSQLKDFIAQPVFTNDVFIGTAAAEVFDGKAGNDTVDYSGGSAVTVNLVTGFVSGGLAAGDTLISIENITGSNSSLAADRDNLIGNNAINHLKGMAGNDYLEGGAGADTLDGGADWDYSIYSHSAEAVNINLETGINTGGEAQGDILIGIEAIIGSAYNDVIIGSNNGDFLKGENGNDILAGGGGVDQLYGGGGTDTFVFKLANAFSGVDQINDFSTYEKDKINIADLLSDYDPLTDLITDFVQITNSGSNSIVSVDVDGGANSFIQIATILGVTGITDEQVLVTNGNLVTI